MYLLDASNSLTFFDIWVCGIEPESLILAQSERWRHA